MSIFQDVAQYVGIIFAAIGALAFIVSLVTEVIKGVGIFKKIPTDALVFILSIALSLLAFLAAATYYEIAIVWFMWVAAAIAGFVVAFLAMFGWEKLSELWQRFKAPKNK